MRLIEIRVPAAFCAGTFAPASASSAFAAAQRSRPRRYSASSGHHPRRVASDRQLRGATRERSQLQAELDDAADEAIYLKVKLRKNEPVARERVRRRARSHRDHPQPRARRCRRGPRSHAGRRASRASRRPSRRSGQIPATHRVAEPNEIPVGTEFDVRLQNSLSSKTAQVEDRFEATTMVDLREGRSGDGAGRLGDARRRQLGDQGARDGSQGQPDGHLRSASRSTDAPIRFAPPSRRRSRAKGSRARQERSASARAPARSSAAILGGTKGALAGILIGGGGTIAATEGKDVELPAGTVLRVRLDSP